MDVEHLAINNLMCFLLSFPLPIDSMKRHIFGDLSSDSDLLYTIVGPTAFDMFFNLFQVPT